MTYSFVFVCQQGTLEIQAMLLAASLRKHLRGAHQLIAAIPTPESRWGTPRPDTVAFLRRLGVECRPIVNEIDEGYPIGNKVSCFRIDVRGDVTVFVDSDMLCLRPFTPSPELEPPFCAKPADVYTFRKGNEHNELWEKAYGSLNLRVPEARMEATVSGEQMPPYFNAGFIAVHSDLEFGRAWLTCCKSIDAHPSIRNKRPWLDQIALPVAVAHLGIRYSCLDETFNYPCHRKPLNTSRLPIFAHYHSSRILGKERVLRECCEELAQEYVELDRALRRDIRWRSLLDPSLFTRGYTVLTRVWTTSHRPGG
jgi:hypothetical protein